MLRCGVPQNSRRLYFPGKYKKIRQIFVFFSSDFYNDHFYFVKIDGICVDILAKMSLS